jgi:cobalt/nickel transport system permease protein
MHIPDGYLGPATWLALYALMVPLWILAFRNADRKLGPRNIPLLAFMACLSFILMMFNLPIPDGTTAHMVGAVLIAILLGPYGALIALTIALLIQALMFGDGGITAFGANVFNMGVVMPFSGILVYLAVRKVAGSSGRARFAAGFLGGYAGLNLAALAAAVEFGIQPLVAPGYCPYGLGLSVPAMMAAHLIVGVVEGLSTASVVYYISENRPDLLGIEKLAPRWMEPWLDVGSPGEPPGAEGPIPVGANAPGGAAR